ncbi:MAG: hypothetical protein J3R72DRAFT_489502 [Linnemannia gamsii]|nr:MAG: hypothetical protein J3R72DRAFT_489493 [Linnemannia gamsii]KAK3843625.1 MAG: hypothetical protein J3R72DRAFT_489502 [Linnemannia gamsii]
MHFFKKSNKNKTASAANTPAQTPAQTPRVSMEESRLVDTTTSTTAKQMKQAHDAEMLHNLMARAMSGGRNAMPFFKSNKNKTASANTTPAQTPAHTPRNSIHEQRNGQVKMTHDEALLFVLQKSMANAASGPYIR